MLTDIALSSESENASSKYLVDISYKLEWLSHKSRDQDVYTGSERLWAGHNVSVTHASDTSSVLLSHVTWPVIW